MNGRVNLVRGAVGARRCQAELTQAGGEWGYQVRGGEDAQGIPVDIYPMEELLSTGASAQTVDLLKCDIEGAEREVFANCGAWIGRVSAMVIELHPPYGLAQLQADLCQAGARFRVVELAEGKALPVAFLKNLDLPINATTKATCVVAELPVLPKTSKRALV